MEKSAEEVLKYLIGYLELCLDELYEAEENDFVYGEKTAYVECLEIIQTWSKAKSSGLDYDIEKKYRSSQSYGTRSLQQPASLNEYGELRRSNNM